MSEKKRLLAFLAHPDDESFGPGGTLAKYTREGVEVHIVIATDGAAGSVVEDYEETRSELAKIRKGELARAVKILGAKLYDFGYRDSGYKNDPVHNDHPDAFINCAMDEAVGKMVHLLRTIRPQVVITHDETGGYYHPDHIHCHDVMVAAIAAAADESYGGSELAPFRPDRLYFTAIPNTFLKFAIFMIKLRRGDPTRVGRNKDIDMTQLGQPKEKIHARVDIKPFWEIKRLASAEHKSQGGGGFARMFPTFISKMIFGRESFMRGYPGVPDGFTEEDLFPE